MEVERTVRAIVLEIGIKLDAGGWASCRGGKLTRTAVRRVCYY